MVHMDVKRVLYSPLPSHIGKFRTKIDCIHYKSTHEKKEETLLEKKFFSFYILS